jgi:hypothetical protein
MSGRFPTFCHNRFAAKLDKSAALKILFRLGKPTATVLRAEVHLINCLLSSRPLCIAVLITCKGQATEGPSEHDGSGPLAPTLESVASAAKGL